ncbi:hypothetical protein Lalb_Chr02g0148961 [Lupinus albus]|uniref:Transmembrane protein n=1 Tax=Lupinus albus TaxID=3870 RepID=A0A6A4QZ88_LUPAL|nr:hypothetical protein Lalb_Chr02g0148961 [Lupinus albus]
MYHIYIYSEVTNNKIIIVKVTVFHYIFNGKREKNRSHELARKQREEEEGAEVAGRFEECCFMKLLLLDLHSLSLLSLFIFLQQKNRKLKNRKTHFIFSFTFCYILNTFPFRSLTYFKFVFMNSLVTHPQIF